MPTKTSVHLSDAQRHRLDRLTRTGTAHARTIQHARVLLLTDEAAGGLAWTDEKAAGAVGCGVATVARIRRRFVREGLDEAVRARRSTPGRPPKIDGTAEAHLVALACSEPPEGRATWSLRLLADEFVALGTDAGWLAEPVSHETVRQALKKTSSAPTGSSSG